MLVRLEPTRSRGRAPSPSLRPERDLSRPLPAALSWLSLGAFVAGLGTVVLALGLSWWLPAWYAVLSVVAFVSYGLDKAAARRDAPRISEQSLLTMGFAGGWPGALLAQQLFRHKTRKRSFRRAFWTTMPALDDPAMLR